MLLALSAWRRMKLSRFAERSDKEEIISDLNRAWDALSTGDFLAATTYSNRVIDVAKPGSDLLVNAKLILLKMKTRQGLFTGLLDELDDLFWKNSQIRSSTQAVIGNEIIRACQRSGNLGIGTLRGEEMIRDFCDRWPITEVVELLCQTAGCHFMRGDTERAGEIITRALVLADESKSPKSIAQSYWQLSMLSMGRGDMTTSLSQTEAAQHWARLAEMNQILPILNFNAAAILLELPHQDLAYIHELAEAAYLELTALNDPGPATYACVTLSEVELRQSNYEGAHLYIDKGLSELPPEIPGPRASLYIQKAKILARTGNYAQSEAQAEIAVEILKAIEPSEFLATAWGHIARVFVEIGLADRGVFAYEQALQIAGVVREEPEIEVKRIKQNHD